MPSRKRLVKAAPAPPAFVPPYPPSWVDRFTRWVDRWMGVFLAILAASFFLPQLGVHRLLVREKDRQIAENGEMLWATVTDLHQRVRRKKLSGAQEVNTILASLEIERAALVRVPTWPWEPGTLRAVMAALLLPIVLWLIQYGLQRFLG